MAIFKSLAITLCGVGLVLSSAHADDQNLNDQMITPEDVLKVGGLRHEDDESRLDQKHQDDLRYQQQLDEKHQDDLRYQQQLDEKHQDDLRYQKQLDDKKYYQKKQDDARWRRQHDK